MTQQAQMRIGLFYNLRQDFVRSDRSPADADAEWDEIETIQKIQQGLEAYGFQVLDLGDPMLLLEPSIRESIDIVFSICEMQGYRFRESLVPSLCEMLKIPYVFSPPDTMMISLDKNLCNTLVLQAGCRVPDWVLIRSRQDINRYSFDSYPYFVKPSAEGSGMGINENSIVYNLDQLITQCEWVICEYAQPVLVQKMMPGREFTIGVIECQGKVIPLTPIELGNVSAKSTPFIFNAAAKHDLAQMVVFHPLKDEPELAQSIAELAIASFQAIGCQDVARVDIRLSDEGIPHFLEINPLPNFNPQRIFCVSAKAFGLDYSKVMGGIVQNAIDRYRNSRIH